MSASRQLLFVDPCKACLDVVPFLKDNGWNVIIGSLETLTNHRFDVGVIRLRETHLMRAGTLKDILGRTGTEWIAAVTSTDMHFQKIRNFVGEWFFDYHTLPCDPERICVAAGRAYGMAKLRVLAPPSACASTLVGDSPTTHKLNALIAKLAPTDASVLIRGDSGTGKELVAHALHQGSRRASGPFVAVNCGAIAENLIQSELFGHEKGAFTGAHQRKIGRIEKAHGGTLFLDEIGDLPLEMQATLLRFLQEGQIERVGSGQAVNVDVRVLAATHVDLEQAVDKGHFREDLYYRLNVLQLHTARLRDRPADIPVLARHFLSLYASEIGRRPRRFSEAAMKAMLHCDWPGNVRELANRVRRGMAMAEGRLIQPADMGLTFAADELPQPATLEHYVSNAEAHALRDVLALHPGNISRAAASLGISRPTFYRLLHKHHLRPH